MMKAISRDTVNAQTYAALKHAIMSAHFRPGESLTLRALSSTLGTSDMPVREALRRLIAERAVEALPNRSPRIPVLSVKRIKEILDLRVLLEGHAAALAAEKITERELKFVESEQQAADAALKRGDLKAYLKHNTKLHFSIYQAAGMDTIIPMIESLWLQYAPTFSVSIAKHAVSPRVLASVAGNHHSQIARALRKGDSELARRALEADILSPTRTEGFWESLEAAGATAEDPARPVVRAAQ